jgi:starch synthase (maltosyl-transferring)
MKPRIYNLFPLSCKNFEDLVRKTIWAANLKFDWVYLNPIHTVGGSGSLYSVYRHTDINSKWFPNGWESFNEFCKIAKQNGIKVMVDLVASHSASDSPLTLELPRMFLWDNGKLVHPGCKESNGSWTTWGDLAKHNWYKNNNILLEYFRNVIMTFCSNGASGFRCDAAYQIPRDCWGEMIESCKHLICRPSFFAETLGCTMDQAIDTCKAGFDYGFNSVAWWDGREGWFLNNKSQFKSNGIKTIGFPESHDTDRVSKYSEEMGRNVLEEQWHRYEISFNNSDGILMPIGYEFMERRRLHVVSTTPDDICMIESKASQELCNRIRSLNEKV